MSHHEHCASEMIAESLIMDPEPKPTDLDKTFLERLRQGIRQRQAHEFD